MKDCLDETKANAYSIGARYGKTVKLSNGTYIEPQATIEPTLTSVVTASMQAACRAIWCEQYSGGLGLEIGKNFGQVTSILALA